MPPRPNIPQQVLGDYQITPKRNPPTGHGSLGAPINKVRKPLRWFDPAVLYDIRNYRPHTR